MAQTVLSYNTKGALTQKQNWVSGTTYLTTIYGPNSNNNGTISTISDLNGVLTTTLHYDGSCGGLAPTSTTDNVTTWTTSVTMDAGCRQGVAVSQTPASGYQSSQTYDDPLFRMDSMTDEAGNVTSIKHQLNLITTTTANPSGSGNITKFTVLDSLVGHSLTRCTTAPRTTPYSPGTMLWPEPTSLLLHSSAASQIGLTVRVPQALRLLGMLRAECIRSLMQITVSLLTHTPLEQVEQM